MPPCPTELTEIVENDSGSASLPRSQSERLIPICREYTNAYQELQEKYHEIIYSTAEKVLRNSQATQIKQLKTCLEKETNDVMRQLNLTRRNEVKALASVHRDRDELVRYCSLCTVHFKLCKMSLLWVFQLTLKETLKFVSFHWSLL